WDRIGASPGSMPTSISLCDGVAGGLSKCRASALDPFSHSILRRRKIRRSHFMPDNAATLERLESSLGSDWPAVRKARSDATATRHRLDELFRDRTRLTLALSCSARWRGRK